MGSAYAESPEEAVDKVLSAYNVYSEPGFAELVEAEMGDDEIGDRFVVEPVTARYEVGAYWDGDRREVVVGNEE